VAETDIINPTTEYWPTLRDSPNPSFGFERRSASNTSLAKARLGAPYSRDTMNDGFAFDLSYLNRPLSTILRLKHFYEQFKGGYFTYIDYDRGRRHHVGRFTSPIFDKELGNGSYSVQSVIFQEIPQARMLEYPADFDNWSRTIYVVDDALKRAVACYSAGSAAPAAWVLQLNPALISPSATDPAAYELFIATPAPGDFAQIQYVGWGFRMIFRTGAAMGLVAIYVDGVYIPGLLDLSTGTRVADSSGSLPPMPAGMSFMNGMLTATNMPLDMHRVKVISIGAGALTGLSIAYPAVQVIV